MNEWHRIEKNWRTCRYTAWVFMVGCTILMLAVAYADSLTSNKSSLFFRQVWAIVCVPGFSAALAGWILAIFMERRAHHYAEHLMDYQAEMAAEYQTQRGGVAGAPRR